MTVCTGRGPDGEHCCYVPGGVCEFLVFKDDRPWCSIWETIGGVEWSTAPVGQYFAETYPGYTCADWPQNIPEVMNNPAIGKCCWERTS